MGQIADTHRWRTAVLASVDHAAALYPIEKTIRGASTEERRRVHLGYRR